MATELLEIQPHVLKFTVEVKKQSLCTIQLGNNSNQYVAFKVKTTSPKKYCVRPNTGIIKPKATCDFTVTMQAQRVALPDMRCKDKFLIQSIVVPFGTTEEDITSDMFAKDSGKYIEEKKLRVILISPPPSPVFLPNNGALKQDSSSETPVQKDRVLSGVENITSPQKVAEDVEVIKTTEEMDELRAAKGVDSRPLDDVEVSKPVKYVVELNIAKDLEDLKSKLNMILCQVAEDVEVIKTTEEMDELRAAKGVDSRPSDDVEVSKPVKNVVELNIAKDLEDLKSKLNMMDSKLREAELTITKLTEERSMTIVEKDRLKDELDVLRSKNNVRRIQVGFPLLYVCMVALISVAVGYLINS